MSKETLLKVLLKLLREGALTNSALPRSFQQSSLKVELLASGILQEEKRGTGKNLRVIDSTALQAILGARFPGHALTNAGDAIANQFRYRDSKGGKRTAVGLVMLRGRRNIVVNGIDIDLGEATQQFGCLAVTQPQFQLNKLCWVENLDVFMRAEQVIGEEWVFAHPIGRLGSSVLTTASAKEILHFGDWDYTGLDEYLRIKKYHPQTQLYIPDQLKRWWAQRATPLKKGAVPTQRLRACELPEVVRIIKLLGQTNQFLEQEAIFTPLQTKTL